MSPTVMRMASAAHALWYRLTGGKLGATVAGAPVLLLTLTGRKSGRRHTKPLLYMEDGDDLVVVASNGGSDSHPVWWLNLRANPEAEVRIRAATRRVRAETATDEERARLWPRLVETYSGYDRYQEGTKRLIPVVILRPRG